MIRLGVPFMTPVLLRCLARGARPQSSGHAHPTKDRRSARIRAAACRAPARVSWWRTIAAARAFLAVVPSIGVLLLGLVAAHRIRSAPAQAANTARLERLPKRVTAPASIPSVIVTPRKP